MDPYQTLGVPKDCTRDELKEAFRAKAQHAHPDRGGEPAAFIRLRQAFDQIRDELDRRPLRPRAETRVRSTRDDRPPKAPDPNWDPDLIVLDEPLPRRRPARPRDPNWQPDLILMDEERPPVRSTSATNPRLGRQDYNGWLRSFSLRTSPGDPTSESSAWNPSAVIALLIAILLTAWIFWAGWSDLPATATSDTATKCDPMRGTE